MSTSYNKPCRDCKDPKPQITVYLDSAIQKWRIKNLDGTRHQHNTEVEVPYPKSTQGEAMRQGYSNTAPPETDKDNDEGFADKEKTYSEQKAAQTWNAAQSQFSLRDAEIKKAHDENIKASTALTNAIHVLAAAIGKLADKQQKDDESVGFEFMSRSDNPENEP